MDPWGTPHLSTTGDENWFAKKTRKDRFSRYEGSHSIVRPIKLNIFSNRSSRIQWWTVSNATDRSIRHKAMTCPESMVMLMFRSAVSVLWWRRYADWVRGMVSMASRWATIRPWTTFSRIFDKNDRFDTCLKFFKSLISSPVFFRSGVMVIFLKASGKTQLVMNLLNTRAMKGASASVCRLITCDGTGSMLHVLPCEPYSFTTSSLVTGVKKSRVTGEWWWMSGRVAFDISAVVLDLLREELSKVIETFLLKLALVSPERFSHSFLEFPWPSTILSHQYSPSFPLNSLCMARLAPIQISLSLSFFDFSYLFWSIRTRCRSARQILSNHGDVRLFWIFIVRFGQCLSRSVISVVSYMSTSSSNSIPSCIADGFEMVEWRRTSLKAHSLNRFHDQTVLIMYSSGFLAIELLNVTSVWSEMNSSTTTLDTGLSLRVTMRSSMWPPVCVGPLMCWIYCDDWSNLSSLLPFESLVSSTCMLKSPQRTMGHRWVASTSRTAVRSLKNSEVAVTEPGWWTPSIRMWRFSTVTYPHRFLKDATLSLRSLSFSNTHMVMADWR